MKIVFLDIDGVLNCHTTKCHQKHGPFLGIDTEFTARLNRLTDTTGAKIIVSSTWRMDGLERVTDELRHKGVTGDIIGITPHLPRKIRGAEIWKSLTQHSDVESFVILDDDVDMGALGPWLVRTSFRDGLQDEHVSRAIAVLNAAWPWDSAQIVSVDVPKESK